MKETILDVLMFMFQSYVEDNEEVELDKESLHKNLSDAGFSDHNIEKAFDWLEGLPGVDDSSTLLNKPTKNSFRLFSMCRTFENWRRRFKFSNVFREIRYISWRNQRACYR